MNTKPWLITTLEVMQRELSHIMATEKGSQRDDEEAAKHIEAAIMYLERSNDEPDKRTCVIGLI